jgi:hypothetical protein
MYSLAFPVERHIPANIYHGEHFPGAMGCVGKVFPLQIIVF